MLSKSISAGKMQNIYIVPIGTREPGRVIGSIELPMAVFETSADYFRFFAAESLRGGSPLYEKLSLGIAEDGSIQRLATKRRKGQPAANLILAAVHYLLLGGVRDPLAEYYPSVGGGRTADDRAFELFRAFCRAHEAEIVDIIANRVTNTNEVGRSALLAPAFCIVARLARAPLGLIEIGSSAGLNLNFDRYCYRYTDETGAPRLERWLGSDLVLQCKLIGAGVPAMPESPPAVGSRLGLELQPIDVSREQERLWLKALVWPERMDRFAKLDVALKIAAMHPPEIRGGDAAENLADALAAVPSDLAPCIYHTVMVYQLTPDHTKRFNEILMAASRKRPVWRVTVEGEFAPRNPMATYNPLRISRYMNGQRQSMAAAVCDPHGLWLEWKAT